MILWGLRGLNEKFSNGTIFVDQFFEMVPFAGKKGRNFLGCPLGSVRAFRDLYEIRTPNHCYGTGLAAFMRVELGFTVVFHLV